MLAEADDVETHKERRDVVAALEKRLAEDLAAAGYEVMNQVNCLKPLNEDLYSTVHAAFAAKFPRLA